MKILLGEIMYKRNLTIRQVSNMTGLPKSTISDIVSGRTSPRMETMERLAAGKKIRIADLYESPFK
ncbi:MAG: helix-turn-helix domain-containing protein [Dorea sp.]|nr:helix-turn-helix domain-containing protein [Dorea sp.]